MVGETWINNTVPTTYAVKTLQRTNQELQEQSDALTKVSEIPAGQRATVQARLQNLQRIGSEMLESVKRGDRAKVAQAVNQIAVEEEAIRTLARSGYSKP